MSAAEEPHLRLRASSPLRARTPPPVALTQAMQNAMLGGFPAGAFAEDDTAEAVHTTGVKYLAKTAGATSYSAAALASNR